MFGQPCHNLATVSKYKVVPRLCQGCKKALWQPCAKVVTTLSFLYGHLIEIARLLQNLNIALLMLLNLSMSHLQLKKNTYINTEMLI